MSKAAVLPALVMSAKKSVWRMNDHAGEGDELFRKMRRAVLDASGSTCRFCQMSSMHGIEVHHADDNHKNNSPANLIATCPLCHQIFHIGLAGMHESADIIYCPELSQAEINQTALMIWMITEAEQNAAQSPEQVQAHLRLNILAKSLGAALGARRGTLMLRFKEYLAGTDFPPELLAKVRLDHLGPGLFSNILMGLSESDHARRGALLGGVRVYPQVVRFIERNKLWMEEQNAVLPIDAWNSILTSQALEEIVVRTNERLDQMRLDLAVPR